MGWIPSHCDSNTASSTTPTTVRSTSGRERGCGIVSPTGEVPSMNARTNASFTIATGGEPAVSRTVKSLPARRAVPYAASHPGVMKLKAMRY